LQKVFKGIINVSWTARCDSWWLAWNASSSQYCLLHA